MKQFTTTRKLGIIILITAVIVLSGCTEKTQVDSSDMQPTIHNMTDRQVYKEDVKEAVIKGDFQEVDLHVNGSGYSPNVIIAKKNITLRINVYMQDESHASEIVFPDFGIDKEFKPGLGLIEILPTKEGTFKFRCPMDMVRGELIIK
jgi:hypothetical protein